MNTAALTPRTKVEWFTTSHETGERAWEAGYEIGPWAASDSKINIVATRFPIVGSVFTVPLAHIRAVAP